MNAVDGRNSCKRKEIPSNAIIWLLILLECYLDKMSLTSILDVIARADHGGAGSVVIT